MEYQKITCTVSSISFEDDLATTAAEDDAAVTQEFQELMRARYGISKVMADE